MTERQFGAITHLGIVNFADVTRVVEQRADHAQHGAFRTQALFTTMRAVIGYTQTRCGQRTVQRMLQVVIGSIATVIAGIFAVEQAGEIRKRGI